MYTQNVCLFALKICIFILTDCKRDDKTYENGEKIVDPENPCRVCVCRG